jgi:hypothetical protein
MIRIVIDADMSTGEVRVTGPIDEPRVMDWALHEAQRITDRRSAERDEKANSGAGLVLAHTLPPT